LRFYWRKPAISVSISSQLGERLLQSQHTNVGDLGAAQDQRVEAGVMFQLLQTGIADSRVLEHENLEAAQRTQVS